MSKQQIKESSQLFKWMLLCVKRENEKLEATETQNRVKVGVNFSRKVRLRVF